MSDFITSVSAPHNIVLTILLAGCGLYWVFVVVFGLGMELLDGAVGFLSHHGGPDVHHGLDTHLDGGNDSYSVTGAALRFLNFGEIPATIILSIILVFTWMGSIVTNHSTREFPFWLQTVVFIGVFTGATLLSKLVTSPLKELFSSAEGKGPPRTDLIGRECILTTSIGEARTGTAEAKSDASRFIIVHVRSAPGQGELPKGARATIVSVDPNAGGYLVALPGTVTTPEGVKSK